MMTLIRMRENTDVFQKWPLQQVQPPAQPPLQNRQATNNKSSDIQMREYMCRRQ